MANASGRWMNCASPRLRLKLARLPLTVCCGVAVAWRCRIDRARRGARRRADRSHPRIPSGKRAHRVRFDVDQRKVIGQVTHTLAALHDGLRQLDFDSVDLTIAASRVNGKDAHFSTDADKLHVDLEAARQIRREIRSRDSLRREAQEGPLFHSAEQEQSQPADGDLDAGRSRRHALLPADLRLSQRPHDHRDDPHRARRLANGVEREAGERGQRRAGNEDLDVAPIRSRSRRT